MSWSLTYGDSRRSNAKNASPHGNTPQTATDRTCAGPHIRTVIEMDINTETQKVIETAKSGEVIRTLSDLRMDKYEERLAALEKTNADLIAANKEMYSFIAANYSKPSANLHPDHEILEQQPVKTSTIADGVFPSVKEVTQTKTVEEGPSVSNVMAKLGYPKMSPDGQ